MTGRRTRCQVCRQVADVVPAPAPTAGAGGVYRWGTVGLHLADGRVCAGVRQVARPERDVET